MDERKRWYTTVEVAEALDLSVAWVRRYAASANVGEKIGRNWAYTAEDVEAIRNRIDRRQTRQRPQGEPEGV